MTKFCRHEILLLKLINDVISQPMSMHAFQTAMREEASAAAGVSKWSCVRGYHVNKDIWAAAIEQRNSCDHHDVAMMKNSDIVGPLPRKILCVSSLFIRSPADVE